MRGMKWNENAPPQSWRTSVRPMLISVALHCEPKQEPTFDGKSELTLQMQATSVLQVEVSEM
jgi:hypothetical protein